MFVADVIDVSQMVRAAESKRSVLPSKRKLLWATEFSWFTNPPNASTGDPPALAGVRTLVALHELWRAGVSQVTWFSVSDDSAALIKGGGFYDSAGNPKPTRDALRFPFIVAQRGSKAYTWGSAPLGATAIVSIQRRVGGGYRTVMNLRPRADGLFSVRFRVSDPKRGRFRAVQRDVSSLSMRATAWDR